MTLKLLHDSAEAGKVCENSCVCRLSSLDM